MRRIPIHAGDVFGKLTVLREHRDYTVTVRCDCGTVTRVEKSNVVRGRTQSCGCLNRLLVKARSWRHGHKRPSATSSERPAPGQP